MIEREPDPPRELSTTRVGGSGSARLVGLVAAGALLAVVWIGLSGHPAERPLTGQPELLATPAASETVTRPVINGPGGAALVIAPWQSRTVERLRLRRNSPLGQDAYSIIANLAGRDYPVVLDEIAPRHLAAAYRIPFPRPATEATLSLAQLWMRGATRSYVPIGSWKIALDPLAPETRRAASVLDIAVAGRPRLVGAPRLLSRGYRLSVRAESRLNSGVLWIDIWLGPGKSIRGDDGLIGWPGVAGTTSSEEGSPAPAPLTAGERHIVSGTVAGGPFRVDLSEHEPGRLTGQYWLPNPVDGGELSFEIDVAPLDAPDHPRRLAHWSVALETLASNHRARTEGLLAAAAARPRMHRAPLAVQLGYELRVSVRLAFNQVVVLDFELRLDPPPGGRFRSTR